MAVVTALAIGTAASIGAGALAAEGQRKAASQQRDAVKDTNALNYRQFLESRGASGSAILPMYLQGTESRLANDAVEVYDTVTGQPVRMTMAQYQNILDQQQPAINAGNRLIGDIYSGDLERQRLASLDPVLAARKQAAEANRGAIDLAYQQEVNRQIAAEAGRGFSGTGSFANNRLLGATIGARQAAAGVTAGANLQNAQDVNQLQEKGLQLKLGSLELPLNRTNQLIGLSQAPAKGVANLQNIAMQPLDFFKIGVGNPPGNRTPEYPYTPSIAGTVLQGIGTAAGQYGNYAANMRLANQLSPGSPANQITNMGGNVPDNFSTMSVGDQNTYLGALQNAQGQQGGWFTRNFGSRNPYE